MLAKRPWISLSAIVWVGVASGCFEPGDHDPDDEGLISGAGESGDDFKEEDVPAGACGETSEGESGGSETSGCEVSLDQPVGEGVFDECLASRDCGANGICAASFERDTRGAYACLTTCIETMDDAVWCADTAACCDAAAVCSARGYCAVPLPAMN